MFGLALATRPGWRRWYSLRVVRSVGFVFGFAKRHNSANMRLRRVGYHPFLDLFCKATEVMVTAYHLTRQSTRTQLRCAGYLIR